MATKKELINSSEFEKALNEGAECKKDMVTSYKSQNKTNFNSFYEVMLESNEEVQKILDIKKKNRSANDVKKLNEFKKSVRSMYGQVQYLCMKEKLEEGQKTRIEKIVDKIVPVIKILRYIGDTALDEEFKRHGIAISTSLIEDDIPALKSSATKTSITGILKSAVSIRQKVSDDNDYINTDIFQTKVPIDLQFDKQSNNTGLKTYDWRRLVDAKAKLIMANSDEAKEKAEEKIEHIASEKQFEAARAELVRDKLTNLQ